ncbi:hypothetical protein BGW38_003567 [Lunasporangiospora selenospora]|uniref:Xaa-Pro dipeptidyl-peptidase-like domain-containing protein n=1 Tax=Lunasporangiospora selenospora TaxID=979761 RepID=A0A9P6KGY4_9FUNG|nr:hypothetical protein BGW38_003567 [Lunasporangiospora selenospora]
MTKTDVSFKSDNLKLAGHLYIPDTYKQGEKLPAIITVHPFGGVKEQTAGVYSKELANHGFITLAFDRRHQGSSEGEPRQLENPEGMTEDVKAAVTFLTLQEQVDPERIGVLGVCAGGGYAVLATSTDYRIKACATVSGVCLGGFIRSIGKEALNAIMVDAGKNRTEVANGGEVRYLPIVTALNEVTPETPELLREGGDYYLTPRGSYKTSINRSAVMGYDRLATFNAFAFADWISPRPLLLIAGDKADTLAFSEEAYKKAKEPKELYLIKDSTHIALYDYRIPDAIPKLAEFYKKNL